MAVPRVHVFSLVHGLDAAKRQIEKIPEAVRAPIARAQLLTGAAIAREASRTVRRRTRALAEAIGYDVDAKALRVVVGVRKGMFRGQRPGPRAHLLEFGTRRAPAYPFLLPAVEEERARYVERLRDARRDIERAVAADRSVSSLL